jgi:hypothetical protein
VSHISTDRVLTGALVAVLRNPGFDALFIDFDPANGIPPGCNWENELYIALRGCEAVVGIDSASWRASQWCFAEIALARSLGKSAAVYTGGLL